MLVLKSGWFPDHKAPCNDTLCFAVIERNLFLDGMRNTSFKNAYERIILMILFTLDCETLYVWNKIDIIYDEITATRSIKGFGTLQKYLG